MIPAAHKFGDWITTKEPSCLETGLNVKTCSACTETQSEILPMLAHIWKDTYTIDKEPTVTETGQKSIHCNVCEKINEDSILDIPKLLAAGSCGESLNWKLNADGILTISGTGMMDSYFSEDIPYGTAQKDERPWAEWSTQIIHIIIEEGVSNISEYAFCGLENLETVEIPTTVTSIRRTEESDRWIIYPFGKCPKLKSIDVAEGNARYYSQDGILYERLTADDSRLFHYPAAKELETFTIPDYVISIDHYAFCNTTGLKKLIIPESVTEICSEAFAEYTEMESLTLSAASTSDEYFVAYVLKGAALNSLKEIHISEDSPYFKTINHLVYSKDGTELLYCPQKKAGVAEVADGTKCINNAFHNCTEITSVNLPDSVTTIKNRAFQNCTKLTELTLGRKVIHIEPEALCYSPFLNIYVSKENPSYTDINGVLYNKKKNTLISYPNSRTGAYQIPDGITTISAFAFANSRHLTELTFNDSIESIGTLAFSDCEKLDNVTIPEGLLHMESHVFSRCVGLKNITLPKSLSEVGEGTFSECHSELLVNGYKNSLAEGIANEYQHNFKAIGEVEPMKIYSGNAGTVSWELDATGTLYIKGSGLVPQIFEDYEARYGEISGKIYRIIVASGITTLPADAFGGFRNLRELYLPESITDIGSDAFGWVEEYQNAEPQKILKSDFTVYVKDGSDAHIYAVINDINYQVYVDEEAVCPLHQYQQEIITNATCTTKGQILYTCNWCLDSYVEETDILPHNFTKWLTIAPTCTQKGYDYRTCTICHKQEKENEKNIISHTYQTIQKKAATCTQPGLYEHFCKICNHSYTTKISITDHSFSNWQTIVPTTSSKGYDYRICASCNKIEKTNETPMLPQENTHTDVKKGKIYTVGANKYKVTNASSVTFIGIKNKSAKTVTVPNTIKIKGKTFHVTSISKGALKKKTKLTKITLGTKIKTIESSAFEGCKKLSLITIKSIALKHVGKNAFKGIKSNAKIKVPAKKFSAYKKMLKGKGQGRKVKISK